MKNRKTPKTRGGERGRVLPDAKQNLAISCDSKYSKQARFQTRKIAVEERERGRKDEPTRETLVRKSREAEDCEMLIQRAVATWQR